MSSTHSLDGLHRSVVVIGGGQAGLSMSYCLVHRGIDHLVLEREQVGHEWANRRWETFCLVTPNWQCQLPGFGYQGNDPNGETCNHMPHDCALPHATVTIPLLVSCGVWRT